ncbi:MAG: hypothetical protein HDP28_02950 [Clostridia bacterium]|nr:hypothetical protein [Clostridia bacterium]
MNTDFVKAILYVYPTMGALSEAARGAAENKALLSYRSRFNAMHDLEEVAEEIFLAERLDSLKRITENLLARLDKEELFLLEYRYFRRKKMLAKFGEEVPCSERNYFRKQEKLLRKIAAQFSLNGVTEEYFLEAYKNSVCLMKVYRAIVSGGEQKIYARREKRTLRFQSSKFSDGVVFLPCAINTATTRTTTAASVIKTI